MKKTLTITTLAALALGSLFVPGDTTYAQGEITDPQVIAFSNEVIRPIAEDMRALDARIDAALVTWYAQISAECPNDSSTIEDGREAEGVSRLVGSDIVNMMTQMAAYQTQLNQGGVAQVISKPCVRALQVQ